MRGASVKAHGGNELDKFKEQEKARNTMRKDLYFNYVEKS
jgi:hypothetical protein